MQTLTNTLPALEGQQIGELVYELRKTAPISLI